MYKLIELNSPVGVVITRMKTGMIKRLGCSTYKRAISLDHAISSLVNTKSGISVYTHNPELIVSLTTIPERIGGIHIVIDSILRQSLKPDRIILWLNECMERDRPLLVRGLLPESLKRLERRGLTIEWCRNIGPYCKLIPTMRSFPNALIATADDDVFYPQNWLKDLYEAYVDEPRFIHCHRAHRMKFDASGKLLPYCQWDYFAPGEQGPSQHLFPTGVGGVLYAPGHLHRDVTNESLFLKLCPKADDVWLKAMAVENGTLCRKVAKESLRLYSIRYKNDRRLMQSNVCGNGNDCQIRNVARHYPVFAALVDPRATFLTWDAIRPEQALSAAHFASVRN